MRPGCEQIRQSPILSGRQQLVNYDPEIPSEPILILNHLKLSHQINYSNKDDQYPFG